MSSRFLQTATRFLAIPFFLATAPLVGCGSNATNPTATAPSANWQIQAGNSITSPPTGAYLLGAIDTQGSKVTGTFTSNVSCSPAVSTYSGSITNSGEITLNSTFVEAQLVAPAKPYTMTTGTLGGGGYLCLHVSGMGPAVGIEIPPFNGTYTGTLTSSTSATGTATLKVTQTSSPNANGQFPVAGTLQFTSGGCNSSVDVAGTISGTVVALKASEATVAAYDNAGGATLPATVSITGSGCSAAPFTGTLALQ